MHTFFLAPEAWSENPVLDGAEAHHLLRVLRLGPGEEVGLLDGRGREALCRIVKTTRQTVELALLNERLHPEPASRVILAAGWGKAARRGWILEKAVELEASALWFWQAERSQFPVPGDIRSNWEGQLIAGAKQCRNPWLPLLRTLPGGVDELIAAMDNGTLEEAWGCGTAAVVSPIGKLACRGKEYIVNGGKIGEITQMLYDTLTGIQWGKLDDAFGWTHKI